MLGLLERPEAGTVRFRDQPVDARDALAERRRMATVFQEPLLADATAADNVGLGLRFRGVAGEAAAPRVMAWLERLGVGALASRQARTLSGGEAQRVALARALVLEPEVLLLDEPFAGLDTPSRTALIADLGAVLRQDRVTTVLVTHDRGEARALADRVAVLIGGRIQQLDAAARVFQAPVSEEVARFVGIETIVSGRVVERAAGVTRVDVGGRTLEVAASAEPGACVRIAIRPEDVILALPRDARSRHQRAQRAGGFHRTHQHHGGRRPRGGRLWLSARGHRDASIGRRAGTGGGHADRSRFSRRMRPT